jgi:lipopolysaccharide export LptBFGC system permease protein LptF
MFKFCIFTIMENLIILVLGLVIGAMLVYFWLSNKGKSIVKQESLILLESTKRVCKLATVEGSFSEIYQHTSKDQYFFNLFEAEKKAMIIVKAKALMGFDMQKMKFEVNEANKTLTITEFPKPELLSLETDCNYYDIKHGTFLNKFTSENLTQIQSDSKNFIKQKIDESNLPKMALEQAGEALALVEGTAQRLGWKVKMPGNLNSTTISDVSAKLLTNN